ncbi:putative protoheme IX biogenesis protein [Leclercia adecarboxylata]|uniref:Putative protoheme IX biogenesis protein n=1 Tax=Leclercia adecarboxylata TaxID=83655 RepID=A0A4U9IY97_9ENTR|nr:putative protoheme IX biogenesis protein [Leclercia adecarboxylata]
MLKVLLLFALLIAGIVLGPMLAGHSGLRADPGPITTISKPAVTGLVIILILAMVAFLAIEWILRRIFRTGAHTRSWFVGRKRRRARKQTEQALLKLAEGDYQQVEKLMSKNADSRGTACGQLPAGCRSRPAARRRSAGQFSIWSAPPNWPKTTRSRWRFTRVRLQLARNENHAARHGVDRLLEIAPAFIQRYCVWQSRLISAPAPGVRCWTSSRRWQKPTWVTMNSATTCNVRPGSVLWTRRVPIRAAMA